MPKINLDAARAAKEEVDAEPTVLILEGREFKIRPGGPAGFVTALGRMQKGDLSAMEEALEAILIDPTEARELLRLGIGFEDLEPIAKGIYGLTLGEALASDS